MTLPVRCAALALFACALAGAEDLTGRWVATLTAPNGRTREITLALRAEGATLTGYVSTQSGGMPILDGKIEGDQISFSILREANGEEHKVSCIGRLTSEGWQVTLGNLPPRQPEQLLAKRVSSEPPALLPRKISLPAHTPVRSNGLAKTPPMGWNSWNKFHRNVNDKVVREIADAMVSSGMKEAGYVYVNIDDTWEGARDAQGVLQPNEKFPDMKALAEYIHSKGLKIGIYSSPGPKTCANFEGSFGHEDQDAKTWAGWGFDYLKYDWCSGSRVYDVKSLPAVYAKMGEALLKSGRPIVYSLCQYGWQNVAEWGASVGGNLWRTTGDISDRWQSMSRLGFDLQPGLEKFAGPGHWNDPDMLEVGNGGMTADEYRTHMSLWSILASPLLAGNDLRDMNKETREILTNREVIAVDQDALGKQGVRVAKAGDLEVWAKPLADGSQAVGLFNRGAAAAQGTARWADLGLSGAREVRDLWAHADRGRVSEKFEAQVPPHGVVMVKIGK